MSELKPCPFCGGEAEIMGYRYDCKWIICKKCMAETAAYETSEQAIAAWNRRAGEE